MSLLQVEDLHGIIFWIMGSLEASYLPLSWGLYFILFFCTMVAYFFTPHLNAFLIGEEFATHIGVNVERAKRLLFLISSFLTALAVSIAGIIGFVGLVVPHIMRRIVGNDHRILLPITTIGGGGFLILCDTIARTIILPRELPVGVVTGIVGGCIFIYFLNKKEGVR
jgi:iron complex transport system permease protein